MDDYRKKLLYRAKRRGFKEMDILMGGFAEKHLEALSKEELSAFENLLNIGDHQVFDWILENEGPIAPHDFETILPKLISYRKTVGGLINPNKIKGL